MLRFKVVKEALDVIEARQKAFQEDLILSVVDASETVLVIFEEFDETLVIRDHRDLFENLISLLDSVGYSVAAACAHLLSYEYEIGNLSRVASTGWAKLVASTVVRQGM